MPTIKEIAKACNVSVATVSNIINETGSNQTVETDERPWGYAMPGLQEEGYLISWWAVDDPMFAADTGFGYRLKGEGNKTCFPWINAVGMKAYWAMKDRFGSVDFEEIENKYF